MSERPFWLVWSPSGDRPPRYRHDTHGSARAEAQRLAQLHPGRRFYVVFASGFAEVPAPPTIWHDLEEDEKECPF